MPPPVPVIVTVDVPVGVDAPAVMVILDDPDPGAAIDAGLKLAVAPVGSPEADSDTAELKLPEIVVDIVEFPEPPCATESEVGDADIEKSLLDGLKMISSTGWSSMPFGATPVCPCRKSNIPTPVTRTGILAV